MDLSKYSFIYDSNNLGKVNNFVEENNLSICVMRIFRHLIKIQIKFVRMMNMLKIYGEI